MADEETEARTGRDTSPKLQPVSAAVGTGTVKVARGDVQYPADCLDPAVTEVPAHTGIAGVLTNGPHCNP